MSPVIRGIILFALPLGIILLPSVYGNCVLKCETESGCVATVSRIPGKECRKIDRLSHDSESSHVDLRVSWSKVQTNVTLSHVNQSGTSVILSLPGRNEHIVCLNISVTSRIASDVFLECRHVAASAKGKKTTLYDPNTHLRLAQALVKRPKHGHSTHCKCKIPYTVNVDILNGTSIRVTWDWGSFSASDVIKVGFVMLDVNHMDSFVTSAVLNTTSHNTQQHVFKDFDEPPGRYSAMVGSANCQGCKRFRQSESFHWRVPSTNAPASRSTRQLCECWTPWEVSMEPVNKTNIILRWKDFYDSQDILTGIVSKDDTETWVAKEQIQSYRLTIFHIREYNFTFDQPPGTYIGLVGSFGCARCMRYRESEPMLWALEEPTTDPMPNATEPDKPEDKMSTLQVGVVIAVGVMSCISVLGVGFFLYRRGTFSINVCQYDIVPSEQVSDTDILMATGGRRLTDVQNILVLRPSTDSEDLKNSAARLVRKIRQRGKVVESKTLSDFSPAFADLIFSVTLGNDVRLPEMLKTVANKTAVVAVNNNGSPVVHAPSGFMFTDLPQLPNNRTSFDLDDFLCILGGQYTAQRVYVIASDDDSAHTDLCLQFTVMLKKALPLESSVDFAGDPKHLSDLRANTEEWVKGKIDAATHIVVVASPQIKPTADIRGSLESLCNFTRLSCNAMDKVLDLTSADRRVKVLLVSLGYWTDSLSRIEQTYLQECQTFTLVKHEAGAEPVLDFEPFLRCLCSDTDVVESTCPEDHTEFLNKVKVKLVGISDTRV